MINQLKMYYQVVYEKKIIKNNGMCLLYFNPLGDVPTFSARG